MKIPFFNNSTEKIETDKNIKINITNNPNIKINNPSLFSIKNILSFITLTSILFSVLYLIPKYTKYLIYSTKKKVIESDFNKFLAFFGFSISLLEIKNPVKEIKSDLNNLLNIKLLFMQKYKL